MPKQNGGESSNTPSFDSTILETEELVRREREKAYKFIQQLDKLLDELEQIKVSAGGPSHQRRRDSGPFRYLGMPMIDAIEIFLDKVNAPQTREQIIKDMKDGGAVLAQQRPEVEVNKSIDYWLLSEAQKRQKYKKRKIKIIPPRLKLFDGDKIGRAHWSSRKASAPEES